MINIYDVLKNYPSFSRINCKGLLFTQYECPQVERRVPFYVETSFIAYVISGRRLFTKNKQTWELNEGKCVFVKKGTHIAERNEGESWCVMVFFMPDDFLNQFINENRKSLELPLHQRVSSDHVLPLDVNELSRSFFVSMIPYFTQTPPPPENLVELKFKELILSLLTNLKNTALLSHLHNLSDKRLQSLGEVMENNYMFNLTLPQFAKLAHKSVPTFNREFKKIYQETPAQWVLKKRLTLATELLETTSLSVREITIECGFENQTHFSRVYKEKKGISPLQHRLHVHASLDK